jgi:outer membrane murein-binding lipoprotein Lpp
VEVFDNWYDACSSMVISAGGRKETRSERLAQWSNRLTASVSKLKNELRQTRMEVFEAQEGTKAALAQVQDVQESLMQEMQVCLKILICTNIHAIVDYLHLYMDLPGIAGACPMLGL